jgi:hypothetical protein
MQSSSRVEDNKKQELPALQTRASSRFKSLFQAKTPFYANDFKRRLTGQSKGRWNMT